MKRKSDKPHLLRTEIGVIVHRVAWFFGVSEARWLTLACETANLTVPPRHYPVPKHARLTRQAVNCMACLAAGCIL